MTIMDGQTVITDEQGVNSTAAFSGLTPPQREWVTRLALDQTITVSVEEARRAATCGRTTVVGAVDGQAGKRELEYLVEVWHQNPKTIAYDPNMLVRSVRSRAETSGATTLIAVKASITDFGTHVPDIDVLIPHPGPWVTSDEATDLASCLDNVLGTGSHAYVLTDNEPSSPGYAAYLSKRIQAINTANSGVDGFVPMEVATTKPTVRNPTSAGGTVVFNGIEFMAGHGPGYRVVHVSRR